MAPRDVHRHSHRGQSVVEPFLRLACCFLEDPEVDRNDETRLLGEGDELGWTDEAEHRVLPADQRLYTDDAARSKVYLRLIPKAKLVPLNGVVQLALADEA